MKKEMIKQIKRLTKYSAKKMNKNDAVLYRQDLMSAVGILNDYIAAIKDKVDRKYRKIKNKKSISIKVI